MPNPIADAALLGQLNQLLDDAHVAHYGLTIVIVFAGIEVLGICHAIDAIMKNRTPQGAIAWAMCLVMFPLAALPLYWIFGRDKFHGYVKARRREIAEMNPQIEEMARTSREQKLLLEEKGPTHNVLERLARLPFVRRNNLNLLIDGQQTFDAIFQGIQSASDYVLIQFFIVKDDQLGRELKNLLIAKAKEGVRVYFLYDEIGCHKLSRRFISELNKAGVDIRAFRTSRGIWNRFQLNFRNHRKIVVVDGKSAYVGGLNVGDEYMGRSKKFGPWRDTHVQLDGAAVQVVQLSFIEDWYWAVKQTPALNWKFTVPPDGNKDVLILPSGPADQRRETCGLMFVHAINASKRRFWLASPYFVPDQQVITALKLAALRGVDVRIMLPEKPDHLLVYLSAFSYLEETAESGVEIYRYHNGFLHHKVFLVDDHLAAVGTANLDNRSFRLNFEITVIADHAEFAQRMEEMFLADFKHCRLFKLAELETKSFWFRVAVQLARLTAPIQ